jgi:hypothetical protein
MKLTQNSRIKGAAEILGCRPQDLERVMAKSRQETAKARAAGVSQEEWLRRNLVATQATLRRVYTAFGPKHPIGGKVRPFPPAEYAKLTRQQVDASWDFPHRHLMHAVAKTLARRP